MTAPIEAHHYIKAALFVLERALPGAFGLEPSQDWRDI